MLVSDDFEVHSNCLSLHIVICKEGIKSVFGLNMRVPYLRTGHLVLEISFQATQYPHACH